MNIKMLVTDLDGTLLRTDNTISEYTNTILTRCKNSGIKIIYATARGESAKRLTSSILFDGSITMNGAIAKINNDIIYKKLIPHQIARSLLMACDNRGLKVTAEINGIHYINEKMNSVQMFETPKRIVNFSQYDIDTEKIFIVDFNLKDVDFIKGLLCDNLYFITAIDGDGFGMIMHKEATKANAVSAIAKYWGIKPSEIIAFGDGQNDVDMLSFAGIAVVMGNSNENIKKSADYICLSNDDDGLAKWLESNLLLHIEG